MRWALLFLLLAVVSMMVLAGCARTGIPECDYRPGKIKGDPVKNCPGIVYYDHSAGQCRVQAAGRGTTCPESAFKVDQSALLQDCLKSAQNDGDVEYCNFRVAERIVDDAMVLCQDKCESPQ